MKKYIIITLVFLSLLTAVRADTFVGTEVNMTGNGTVSSLFMNDDIVSQTVVKIDGQMYLQITYQDGTSKLFEYIQQNEDDWSTDTGISFGGMANKIEGAIDWLLGRNNDPDEYEQRIGTALDDYAANNPYTQELLMRITDLEFRVEALENALEEINSTAYCQGKLEVLHEYGLTGVKCGDTYYRNHMESPTGESIIVGLTPANGKPTKPENMTKLESNIVIDSLDVPDKVYLDKPFSLKAMVKNQGDETTEDYITLALPEGWEAITPTYYTVNLEKGQSQIVYFGIKPTTTSGEIAVGSSVDFKSASIRAQPLSITSRVIQPISKFMGTLDITILGILVACIAIPVLFIMKKSTIMGIVHQAKPGTRFNYSYRVK
ncbi:MAG: hypothetical protein J7J93_01995 [Candidatus Aenigmarchaeota archaeon]|nr:hypothetical protein [Candidatus Aenigmarchaeota archaeon]